MFSGVDYGVFRAKPVIIAKIGPPASGVPNISEPVTYGT
jgi:hypothetical protein